KLAQVSTDVKPLGNKQHVHVGYKTSITNHTGKAIQLEVTDQVPASRDASYTVKSTLDPAIPTMPEDGVFTWKVKLDDGKAQDFPVEYDVTWPEGDQPVMLD